MLDNVNLIDPNFSINNTFQYHISLQLMLKGFSFCIIDTSLQKYIALKHYKFEKISSYASSLNKLNEIFNNDELLYNKFKSVKLIFASQRETLVPLPLFSNEDIKKYFYFNQSEEKNEEVLYNKIKNSDAVNIFSIPTKFINFFNNKFDNITYYHQSTPFIENALIENKNQKFDYKVYVYNYEFFFDVIVISPQKLLFYNTFKYKNENDFAYYLMNIFEQLKLNPSQTPVYLMGDITKQSDCYNIIKKFITNIYFKKLSNSFDYSYVFNQIPEHYFFNMLNLYQCE
ncbi:MAG: hypothetical protein DRJ01_07380 [Bacteroidetes bacterium]|nr:MAG: hypothetical protein DRJ01_07380 [Bacteroidota bacterium]